MLAVMSSITALVLAAFVGYGGAWYIGMVEGNFALLLFLATVVTGVYWLAERLYFLPQRKRAAEQLQVSVTQRRSELSSQGLRTDEVDLDKARNSLLMQPWWLDWTAGLFPVIVVVFVLRSFLFEPFKIPSGSMIPTLMINDLILVNKFHYGVRLPVSNIKLFDNHSPERGDVMVFRYPPKPSLDYIKRVVGLPGDEVAYLNKKVTVNGKPLDKTALPEFFDEDALRYTKQYQEVAADGQRKYRILNEDDRPSFVQATEDFPFRENCRYSSEGVVCKVPPGHYFMMGDNRDNSLDSRFWGFVPEKNIVGKAFFVWMNFGNLKRIGGFD
jgi:signal peptidase I